MRVDSASIGSRPDWTQGSSGSHQPEWDDDLVTDRDVVDLIADAPDDARAVAATGVEVLRLALALAVGDDVDRGAERGPDVVVVDAGRHDVDQHVLRADLGGRDDLALPGVARFAEAVLADQEGVHLFGHVTERRALTEIADFHFAGSPNFHRQDGRPRYAQAALRGQRMICETCP